MQDSQESSSGTPAVSKWELMEQTGEKLGIWKSTHNSWKGLEYQVVKR